MKTLPPTTYNLQPNNGFTLIELLIYLAIVGIVITSFVVFSVNISGSRTKNYVIEETQANSRVALDLISQKIRESNGINISSSTFGADPGTLSLSMADASKDPTVLKLNQDDGVLQIIQGADAPLAITSNEVKITNLVFTDLSAGSDFENIRVEMTVEFNNPGDSIEYDYSRSAQTAVSLRQ